LKPVRPGLFPPCPSVLNLITVSGPCLVRAPPPPLPKPFFRGGVRAHTSPSPGIWHRLLLSSCRRFPGRAASIGGRPQASGSIPGRSLDESEIYFFFFPECHTQCLALGLPSFFSWSLPRQGNPPPILSYLGNPQFFKNPHSPCFGLLNASPFEGIH